MLNQEFVEKGFSFIGGNDYIDNQNHASLHDLKKSFDLGLDEDKNCPFRRRAYLKVEWRREANELRISENQAYFQTAASNVVDGGSGSSI